MSEVRVADIDTGRWLWTVRRQTTPSPGGLVDKGTEGRRARFVPLIAEVRDLVQHRIDVVEGRPDARLFTGPTWSPRGCGMTSMMIHIWTAKQPADLVVPRSTGCCSACRDDRI
nr:hypothetical protein [Pseudonocardia sp. AL041005-10]